MSARDDYPLPHVVYRDITDRPTWEQMCDEIDRLRAREWLVDRNRDVTIKALDELIETLTTHADAMRNHLQDAADSGLASEHWVDEKNAYKWCKTIQAYDEFMKEC